MTAEIHLQFYDLLRTGLGLAPHAREALFASGRADWPALFRLAVDQAVAGVAWDGIRTLPESCRPPQEIALRWAGMVSRIERANLRMNRSLAEIHAVLSETIRLPYVLLKGQGTAAAYPVPLHRQCGDIDLYAGRKAIRTLEYRLPDYGFLYERNSTKHVQYNYKGIRVEIHRVAALFFSPFASRRFRCLVEEWFPAVCSVRLLPADAAGRGRNIPVPPDWFEAAFAVAHFASHLRLEGVGFRHLCDWYVLRHRPGLSEEHYRRVLRILRMERMEAAMEELSARVYTAAGKALSQDAARLERALWADGNLGHSAPDARGHSFASSGGLLRVLFRLWRHDVRRSIRFFRFAPLESVLTPFFRSAGYIRRFGR